MTTYVKSRHWFRFHLSTSIVLMFVAAGFMWTNCQTYQIDNTSAPVNTVFYINGVACNPQVDSLSQLRKFGIVTPHRPFKESASSADAQYH